MTAGVEPSVGSVGASYDNALVETINRLYKVEVIHRRGPWRSFEAVEFATLEWFNTRRLLEPIGNVPSAEAEAFYFAQAEVHALPHDSNQMAFGKPGAVHWRRMQSAWTELSCTRCVPAKISTRWK